MRFIKNSLRKTPLFETVASPQRICSKPPVFGGNPSSKSAFSVTVLQSPLFDLYVTYQDEKLQKIKYQQWVDKGKPIPLPPVVKQRIVKDYAKRSRLSTFVETGTFQGGMVNFVKRDFKKIYSIELGVDLYQQARDRFARYRHIKLLPFTRR